MMYRLIQKASILAVPILLSNCRLHTKNAPVFFSLEQKAEIHLNSACRNSILSPLSNEAELKTTILQSSKESIKKLKLKTSDTPEKASYRITQTELFITEKCGDKTTEGKPQINLAQVLTLENNSSKELLQFKADTAVVNASSLAQPAAAAPEKPDLKPYINGLTNENFLQVKKHFGIK